MQNFRFNWWEMEGILNELFYAFDNDCDDVIDWRDFARALRVFEYPKESATQKLMVSNGSSWKGAQVNPRPNNHLTHFLSHL